MTGGKNFQFLKMDEQKYAAWVMDLFRSVSESIHVLEIKEGWTEGETDERSDLEKSLHRKLNDLWDELRRHPEFRESADAPIQMDFQEISESERGKNEAAFAEMMRQGLANFLKLAKVRKQTFAAVWGCNPPHVSRMLSGQKPVSFAHFADVCLRFGYSVRVSMPDRRLDFTKIA